MNWREYPFIRLLAPFLLGILLAFFCVPPFGLLRHFFLLPCFLSILLFATWRRQTIHRAWLFGLSAMLFFLTLGYQLTYQYDDWNRTTHFRHWLAGEDQVAIGRILALQDKGDRWQVRMQVEQIEDSSQTWRGCSGRLLAYIDGDSSLTLRVGQRLLLEGRISRIRPPYNPGAFDFSRYMRVQNIYFQTFCKVNEYRILAAPFSGRLSLWMTRQQSKGVAILRRHLRDDQAFGVGAALILGSRSELDEGIREAYSQTGAMHVLAVSGLHVGMVALFLGFLLKRIRIRNRKVEWFKLTLQVAGIWGFALLTGASPSVLRAAGMFSMLILGIHLHRYSNIYNTLAASAFLLLCFRPFMLMELGFQLSYLAVLGIVYFQPRLYRLWYVPSPAGRWAWKLVCVSLAAQITTLPISLYYFHQFPVYFWLSGLVVVPAAMLMLPIGLALLAGSKIPLLSIVLGKILLAIISGVNGIIQLIKELPGHLIDGIWIGSLTLCLLYLIVIFVVLFLERRRRLWLNLAMLGLLAIGIQNLWRQWEAVHQRQLVFYRIYQHTAVDFIDGKESYTLSDGELPQEKLERANQYFQWSQQVKQARRYHLEKDEVVTAGNWMYQEGFAQFYDLRVAVLESEVPAFDEPIEVDYLLIRNNPEVDISAVLQSFAPRQLVFDASNHLSSINRWKAVCRQLNQPFHDLNEQGALIIDLNARHWKI